MAESLTQFTNTPVANQPRLKAGFAATKSCMTWCAVRRGILMILDAVDEHFGVEKDFKRQRIEVG
jgi:hypothetical protein